MQAPEQARNIAEALVERGIAAGATAADALYAGDRSSSVEVRLGETESVSRSEGEEIGLRLFVGQRSATVASSDLSDEALGVLVERCLAMAQEAPEDPYAGLAPPELLRARRAAVPRCRRWAGAGPRRAARASARGGAGGACRCWCDQLERGGASASASTIALATSGGFSGAYRSSGHGCSASVIAGEGGTMQRDHAWHSARYLADLEGAAEIGRRAGERAVARLNPSRPKPGQISGDLRSARIVEPARPLLGRDQRRVDRAQDELPSRQARQPGIRGRRHDRRRSAAPARARGRGRSMPKECGSRGRSSCRTACSRAGSPTARRLGSSGSSRPAMPRAESAGRPARRRATSTWKPGAAAARSCWRAFPKRCW